MKSCFVRIKEIISLILFLFLILFAQPIHSAESVKQILLLNSYDQRMPWVEGIAKGVEDLLQPDMNGYSLYVENMDSKEFNNTKYFALFRDILAEKYKNKELDLILSSDNNAYDFLRKNRDYLFPDVPVVFCGVNNFKTKQLEGLKGFTGVVEIFSAEKTIELALRLQPNISRIYVINDYLKTGRLWSKSIETSLSKLASEHNLTIEPAPNLTIDELLEKVAGFGPETIILFGTYFTDRNRQPFKPEQLAQLLSKTSSVPIYCLVDFLIDDGFIGGHVISGYYQGYSMAQLGISVLIGTAPEALPIMMKGSNKPIVNYQQLVRFGLDEKRLSPNITVINRPFSFYDHYKREIWIALSSISALLFTILALIVTIFRLGQTKVALKESEVQFRQLANATWETVVIHNKGILLQANELFTEMFGFEVEELLGKYIPNIIFSEDSRKDVMERVISENMSLYEAMGKRKDGTTFPVEIRVRKINFQGTTVRVAAIRDISERRDMEEMLFQSQKLEAIGTLAGGIAHDFNNILSAIIGHSQLILLKHSKESQTAISVEKILKAGNRAKTLIQQILTFANKSEQKQEAVQVSRIIKEAMILLRPSMAASIEITTELHSNSYILSDSTKIHQIVMNLCANAGKAMPNGGILKVTLEDVYLDKAAVSAYKGVGPGSFIQLSVTDNGIGMAEDILPRIFDPFFTTRGKSEGTGLGLSVVHGIVKEIGGFVIVHSKVNQGSIFKVHLPILVEPEISPHLEDKKLVGGTETIMLVDDESDLIEVTEQELRSFGYTVEGYVDCLEAVNVFEERPDYFDLVITDMTMPKMSGDKLATHLLNIRPDIPLIICTGYSDTLTEEVAKKLGIKKFLSKPVDIGTLITNVRDVLSSTVKTDGVINS